MGSLADDLEADDVRVGTICFFCEAYKQLDADDQAVVRGVVASGNGAALDRVLKERGYRIASQATTRHRRGDCLTWVRMHGG